MENHNMSKSRIYSVWRSMKKRCYRETDKEYKSYGGRGIKVCDNWKNSFLNFYNWSIENGYIEETMLNNRNRLTLDRINNDGNYEPSNCRWVTRDEQDKNRANNFIVEFKGKQYTISELSEMCDIDRTTLYERVAFLGWSIEDAMTRPIRKIKGRKKEFMDKYYLIRDKKSGAYLLKGREWTKDVELATRYKSKKLAERSISNSYLMALMDCEVVELPSRVEIFADLEAKLAEMETERDKLFVDLEETSNNFQNARDEWLKQLAESESKVKVGEFWHSAYQGKQLYYDKVYAELRKSYDENEKLKQQLAEKDVDLSLARNEIDTLKHNLKVAQEHDSVMCEQYFEKGKKINQDKISFCIDKLEKTKKDIENGWKLVGYEGLDFNEVIGTIDNQIEELKKEMK